MHSKHIFPYICNITHNTFSSKNSHWFCLAILELHSVAFLFKITDLWQALSFLSASFCLDSKLLHLIWTLFQGPPSVAEWGTSWRISSLLEDILRWSEPAGVTGSQQPERSATHLVTHIGREVCQECLNTGACMGSWTPTPSVQRDRGTAPTLRQEAWLSHWSRWRAPVGSYEGLLWLQNICVHEAESNTE